MKVDVERVEKALAETKSEMMRWTAALALVIIGAVGAIEALSRLLGG